MTHKTHLGHLTGYLAQHGTSARALWRMGCLLLAHELTFLLIVQGG